MKLINNIFNNQKICETIKNLLYIKQKFNLQYLIKNIKLIKYFHKQKFFVKNNKEIDFKSKNAYI